MKNISDFLGRFKKIKPPHKFIKEEFISLVKKDIDFDLNKEDIDIKNNKIQITSDSTIIKTEIILKKNNLLKELNKNLIQYNTEIKDIY